jgi:hypothetical protein
MQRYWTPYFLTPLGVEQSGFLIGTVFTQFFLALGGAWRVTAALLFLVPLTLGLVRLWKDQGAANTLLVGLPLAAVIGASVLRFYPFASRLLLFGAASTIIVIAAGLDDLADRIVDRGWHRWAQFSCSPSGWHPGFIDPPRRDLGPLSRSLRKTINGGAVYVFDRSVPAATHHGLEALAGHRTGRILGCLVAPVARRSPCAERRARSRVKG